MPSDEIVSISLQTTSTTDFQSQIMKDGEFLCLLLHELIRHDAFIHLVISESKSLNIQKSKKRTFHMYVCVCTFLTHTLYDFLDLVPRSRVKYNT